MFNIIKIFFISITLYLSQATATPETGKLVGGKISDIPEWFKDSFLEIEEDVEEATESGKHLLLYMHLTGCPYCFKMIDEGFKNEPNLSNIKQNFDVIAININGNRDVVLPGGIEISEKEIGEYLKVMFTPTLVFLNNKSKHPGELGKMNSQDYRDIPDHPLAEKTSWSNNRHGGKYCEGLQLVAGTREHKGQIVTIPSISKLLLGGALLCVAGFLVDIEITSGDEQDRMVVAIMVGVIVLVGLFLVTAYFKNFGSITFDRKRG